MKRFVYGLTSKAMVTTEEKVTTYETWLQESHASYTPTVIAHYWHLDNFPRNSLSYFKKL